MTKDELIELSRAAAKVAGIEPHRWVATIGGRSAGIWFYEDSARCFELMCQYNFERHIVGADIGIGTHTGVQWFQAGNDVVWVNFRDHNNDRSLATRVAILRAIVAQME